MAANHRKGAEERADGRREATFADLLVRVDALGRADVEIERSETGAGLPAAFLSKARAGKNRGDRATASWAKLASWLAAQGGQAAKGLTVLPVQAASSPAIPQSFDLISAIKAAKSYESLGELIEHIMLGVADGSIEKGIGAVLIEAAREQRQLVKGAEHEKAMRTLTTNARHLSVQEAQWITDMRAAKTPPSATPDQSAPPPSSAT